MFEAINNWDANALMWIQTHLRHECLTPFWRVITTLGNAGIFWVVLSVALIIPKKTRKLGITCFLALLCSLLINNVILKNLVNRPRPFTTLSDLVLLVKKPRESSFPSGHTASSFAAATVIFCRGKKPAGIAGLTLAAMIAFSRLYLGCHYPLDVLAGMIFGVVSGVIGLIIMERFATPLKKHGKITEK